MVELLFKTEAYAIIGAAMEVYNTLGPGFLEAVYQEALKIEFERRNIPFISQKAINVFYDGILLKTRYVADFLAYEEIIIEIKAIKTLSSREEGQLLNYLKATGKPLGLLINFGSKEKLAWKRMVLTNQTTNFR